MTVPINKKVLFPLCCVLAAAHFGQLSAFAATSGESMLSTLRDFDSTILEDCTITSFILDRRATLPVGAADTERLLYNDKFTTKGGLWATWRELDESVRPTQYLPPGSNRDSTYDSSGNMEMIRIVRRVALNDQKAGFRGVHRAVNRSLVKPDGTGMPITSPDGSPKTPFNEIWLSDYAGPLGGREICLLVLASGHGYSLVLDTIESVSQTGEGLIRCEGTGRSPGDLPSRTWELILDPDTAYMVRYAKCTLPGARRPTFEMANEGTRWFQKGPLPEFARAGISAPLSGNPDDIYEITFGTLEPAADEEILANAQKLLRGEPPMGTTIRDRRGGKRESHTVGEAELALARAETSGDRKLPWSYCVAPALVLLFLGGIYVFRKSRPRAE